MERPILLFVLLFLLATSTNLEAQKINYADYHLKTKEAEELIASENYDSALKIYDNVFTDYTFVFQRDCKIATQLALYQGKEDLAFQYLRRGVSAGWEMKQIKKNDFLKRMQGLPHWHAFENDYPRLYADFESSLNSKLRTLVRKMFSKDQKKALGALFTFGSKGQDKYAEKKFAPHSEQQMKELIQILSEFGYPGEKLIGNDFWTSTILSHHNSISEAYARQDTIYPLLKPELKKALIHGEVSPYELALIDEWYRSTLGQSSYLGYGILDPPSESTKQKTNHLRAQLFLRSVETRNALVDIQDKTKIDFYLPGEGWIKGKIEVVPN